MKNKILFCLLLTCSIVSAQQNCSRTSPTYIDHYRTPQHWIPDVTTPVKTIKINFIICHDDNGNGTVPNTPATNAALHNLVDSVNHFYANSLPKGYPSQCPVTYGIATDSKIRISLQAIYHFSDNGMFLPNTDFKKTQAINTVHSTYPSSAEVFNIFCVDDGLSNSEYFQLPNNPAAHAAIFYKTPQSSSNLTSPLRIGTLVHEIAHGLGLGHVYGSEIMDPTHFDFLGDVLGNCPEDLMINSQSPCFDGCNPIPPKVCPLKPCFFAQFTGANPLMSGQSPARYISPAQMGRFHRTLSLIDNFDFGPNGGGDGRISKYVEEKHSYITPYVVHGNEIWDFGIKMYQDIIVWGGATLKINCEVRMPIDGKIIVKPGGQLIVNGGKITCAHEGEHWGGIEVWGTTNFPQTNAYQGRVEINNGGIIEHAHIGVNLWRDNHWNETGGIIIAENATFINNWKSVQFMKYERLGSNGILPNVSSFNHVDFIWDDNYQKSVATTHVSLYKVHGVLFEACNFKDDRSFANSHEINSGIYSLDANFVVNGDANTTGFSDLEYGVWAKNANSEKAVYVRGNYFENNLTGIEIDCIHSADIIFNSFSFDQDNHFSSFVDKYGVHALGSTDIKIEENYFYSHTHDNRSIGVLCSNLGENPEEVRKNTFQGLTTGILAQGLNRSMNGGRDGLQFICNTNYNNFYDFYVSGELFGTYDPTYGVRRNIGDYSPFGPVEITAGNVFTQSNSTGFDFINTSNNLINYYCASGQNTQQPVEISGGVTVHNLSTINECSSSFGVIDDGVGTGSDPWGPESQKGTNDFYQPSDQLFQKSDFFGKVNDKRIEAELSQLSIIRLKATNHLIRHHKQAPVLYMDSVRTWIKAKNEPLAMVRIIDTYLEEKKLDEAMREVNDLKNRLSTYPNYLQKELQDVVFFKSFIINVMRETGKISNLEEAELSFLQNMAKQGTGIAKYQAQNTLCFFYGECPDNSIQTTMNAITRSINKKGKEVENEEIVSIYPNPANDHITIEVPISKDAFEIIAYDLKGKKVIIKSITESTFRLDTKRIPNGMYLINVKRDGSVIESKKIMIQH